MRIGIPSGWTSCLDLAKARSRLRGSTLGFSLSSPHQRDRFSLYMYIICPSFFNLSHFFKITFYYLISDLVKSVNLNYGVSGFLNLHSSLFVYLGSMTLRFINTLICKSKHMQVLIFGWQSNSGLRIYNVPLSSLGVSCWLLSH